MSLKLAINGMMKQLRTRFEPEKIEQLVVIESYLRTNPPELKQHTDREKLTLETKIDENSMQEQYTF